MSADVGKNVYLQQLNLADYTYEEVCDRFDQIVNPNPLCVIYRRGTAVLRLSRYVTIR